MVSQRWQSGWQLYRQPDDAYHRQAKSRTALLEEKRTAEIAADPTPLPHQFITLSVSLALIAPDRRAAWTNKNTSTETTNMLGINPGKRLITNSIPLPPPPALFIATVFSQVRMIQNRSALLCADTFSFSTTSGTYGDFCQMISCAHKRVFPPIISLCT